MRGSRKRRENQCLATFSTKVDELLGLYHGMTVANKRKATAILSSSLRDLIPILSLTHDGRGETGKDIIAAEASPIRNQRRGEGQQPEPQTSVHNETSPPNELSTVGDRINSENNEATSIADRDLYLEFRKFDGNTALPNRKTKRCNNSQKKSSKFKPPKCTSIGICDPLMGVPSVPSDVASLEDGSDTYSHISDLLSDSNTLQMPIVPVLLSRAQGNPNQRNELCSDSPLLEQTVKVFSDLSNGCRNVNLRDQVESVSRYGAFGDPNVDDIELNFENGPEVEQSFDENSENISCFDVGTPGEMSDGEIMGGSISSDKPEKVEDVKRKVQCVTHRCHECGEVFTHGRPFKRHLIDHADGLSPLCCRKCKTEFSYFLLWKYHQCHSMARPVACKECDRKFLNEKRLQRHMRLYHEKEPMHVCQYCNRSFRRKIYLIKHLKEHADGQHVCLRCGAFFREKDEYFDHIAKHDRDAEYMCEKCGLEFHKMRHYRNHMKTHERFECPECHMLFPTRKAHIRHNRLVHAATLGDMYSHRYKCGMCPKSFPRPGLLDLHSRVHSGERPMECRVCSLFFRTPKALKKHKTTNTHLLKAGQVARERNHLCALCGQAYFRKYALQRHMKTHCDDRPFSCPHCDYKCKESTNLKRHVMRHMSERNFICEMCGSSFHTKKTLETHVVYKHSDNRDHKCTKCTMAFKTPNALTRHMTSHSDARPHTCWCGSGFNRLYNLRRHMKSVHGTDDDLPPVRKVRVLNNQVRDVENTGSASARMSDSSLEAQMHSFDAQEMAAPTMVNVPRPGFLTDQVLRQNYPGSVTPVLPQTQSPSIYCLPSSTPSLPDLKPGQLPSDLNYQVQQSQLTDEDKVAQVTSRILSELRESARHVEISANITTPSSNPSVQSTVPTLTPTSEDENQQYSVLTAGVESVLQDLIHRPTINTYDRHIYFSQPTSAPVERKTFLPNISQNYLPVHDLTNYSNATSLYGAQFYTDPQRQRTLQVSDGLEQDLLSNVSNGLTSDINKFNQGGTQ